MEGILVSAVARTIDLTPIQHRIRCHVPVWCLQTQILSESTSINHCVCAQYFQLLSPFFRMLCFSFGTAEYVFWERNDDAYYREPQALDLGLDILMFERFLKQMMKHMFETNMFKLEHVLKVLFGGSRREEGLHSLPKVSTSGAASLWSLGDVARNEF